jgi:hypothetical protein
MHDPDPERLRIETRPLDARGEIGEAGEAEAV